MKPVASAICDQLLQHQRNIREAIAGDQLSCSNRECLISYGELCQRAGYPQVTESVGAHLQQIADWCRENGWPPLNALAVNASTGMPGDGYNIPLNCDSSRWWEQANAALLFEGYPEHSIT
jgi:hypothetical protein